MKIITGVGYADIKSAIFNRAILIRSSEAPYEHRATL